MTLTTRTVPILALAAALAVPATAVAQDGARDRARLEAERAQLQRDLQRLDRELARDAQTHAQELARATGEIVRGLAIEAGMLAGRFAGDVVEDVVRDMSADGRFFAQRGVPGLRGDGPEVTDTVSRTVTLGDAGTFELTNLAGDITITATGGDQAVVEAVKRVRNRDEAQGRAQLDALEVEFTEQPGRLEVRTDFPNDRRLSAEVEFTVRVPAGTRVRVRTVSGGIQLTGIQGEVRAESISGNVTVSDASRIDLLKTVSGTLSLTDAELENGTVSAVSGDVVLSDVRGRSLDAQAVSGRISLVNVQSERVTAESVSGDIEFEGPLTRNGRYELSTHSGRIRMAVEGDTGFDLNASTFSGNVESDYPLELRGRRDRGLGQSVRGSYGDASAVLDLRSFSGTISLEER